MWDSAAFVGKARAVHGDRYDYTKSTRLVDLRVVITCPEHGDFRQFPSRHLKGSGCLACRIRGSALGADEFIRRATAIHGPRYDYSGAEYVSNKTAVSILCHDHGAFLQTPNMHLRGQGCPICFRQAQGMSMGEFLRRAHLLHGHRYGYPDRIDFKDPKVELSCPIHGAFSQYWHHHIAPSKRYGCPACGVASAASSNLEACRVSFADRARLVHGGEYEYGTYTGSDRDIEITCPAHGVFTQIAAEHLRGAKCPACRLGTNPGAIRKFLIDRGLEVEVNNRTELAGGLEMDLWIPALRIGIEHHGLYWHSTPRKPKDYHQTKHRAAVGAGLFLIQLFEDEWDRKREICESMLLAKTGLSPHRLMARKLRVAALPAKEGRAFFGGTHLQGADSSSTYLALHDDAGIVSCLSLTRSGTSAKVQRFASRLGCSVPGAFSRLLSRFLRDSPDIRTVDTYANLRYSDGGVYKACGFFPVRTTVPGYFYVNGGTREPRQKYQRHKLEAKGHSGTERSITESLGLVRIYDAGHLLLRKVVRGD